MKQVLALMVALAFVDSVAQAAVVVNDDFSGGALNTTIWNDGGGFFYSAPNENVLLSTFGSPFGKKGNTTPLINSTVGYASFTVTDNGVNPLGGNFQIGKDEYANSNNSIARVNFQDSSLNWTQRPVNLVELVWNMSGATQNFELDSGFVGSIADNSSTIIINGDDSALRQLQFQFPTTRPNTVIAPGDSANRFGFWINSASDNAVIDNVLIRDTLVPTAGTPGDFDGDGDRDGADFLIWQRGNSTPVGNLSDSDLMDWQSNYGQLLAAVSAVPEPSSVVLLGLMTTVGLMSRRRTE